MVKPMQYLGQGLFYALFFGVIGYFSTWPTYTYLQPDETVIKLSFAHAGQLKEACRERTPEEIAKLPMYQRKVTTVCDSRERADVVVELEVDGKQLYHVVMPPNGFARSGTSNIYRRIQVKAGTHTFKVRLKDHVGDEFNFTHEETVNLAPGRIMVIDFKAATGGFIFKNKSTT
ncbi:MAG TPA: hypothetical protein VMW07_03920 [Gallionella sp.]|jgi:hypothetical protein|nr:hypothetical protein [Gallionella sp.]